MIYTQSFDINDYKGLQKELYEDFGKPFVDTTKTWCREDMKMSDTYWQVWLVQDLYKSTIGICGLYTIKDQPQDEYWLGWFGIIPLLRNIGLGANVLNNFLIPKATSLGASKVLSYVDEDGAPLKFYSRNGFKLLGTVRDYAKEHNMSRSTIENEFESTKDFVIEYNINQHYEIPNKMEMYRP